MSGEEQQNIIDINNMIVKLKEIEITTIKEHIEKIIDTKLLTLVPDIILENMDVTEKLMMIDYYSLPEEERTKEEVISFEDALKKAGLSLDELQN